MVVSIILWASLFVVVLENYQQWAYSNSYCQQVQVHIAMADFTQGHSDRMNEFKVQEANHCVNLAVSQTLCSVSNYTEA